MSNTPTKGCPRCDDYDEVVEELKKEKDSHEQKTKSELHKCEERHKKKDTKIKGLEKKILTMTIAAVVGGTIIGREFIDEIASYLKSFNSVKNAADALSGSLPVITVSKNEEEEREEDIEEINEYPTLTFAPRKPSTTEWPPMVSTSNIDFDFADRFDLISLITEDALQQNEQAYMSMSIKDTFEPSSRIYDLTKYSIDIPYTEAFKEYPSVYTTADMTTFVVPESDAWALLVLPCFINKRRRRV